MEDVLYVANNHVSSTTNGVAQVLYYDTTWESPKDQDRMLLYPMANQNSL